MATYSPPARNASPHLPFGDQRSSPFYGKDILSVNQFTRDDLEYIFGVAHEMREMVERVGTFDLLKGKILANLFYEPSTRTSSSFTSAMERLGGSVIPINEVRYSSVSKGESLPDTVRTLECYADVIVLRHPEVGASALAAQYARKPIINAGDGVGEHPTQALLDLFTIQAELGQVDGLTVTMLGDLKYGRTVHSLARLLSLYSTCGSTTYPLRSCACPRRDPDRAARERHSPDRIRHASKTCWPRRTCCTLPASRRSASRTWKSMKGSKALTSLPRRRSQTAKEQMIVMHPLPRVGEISMDVDNDPRAAYFRQMEYGLYVRMALLAMVLGKA